MKQIDDYEPSLQFWANQADRCHARLLELADNDRTKWTPQYQRMLDAHEIKTRFDAELDLMAANAYPESWVRDVVLGNQDELVRCGYTDLGMQCVLDERHHGIHELQP